VIEPVAGIIWRDPPKMNRLIRQKNPFPDLSYNYIAPAFSQRLQQRSLKMWFAERANSVVPAGANFYEIRRQQQHKLPPQNLTPITLGKIEYRRKFPWLLNQTDNEA